MSSYVTPKKNTAFIGYVALVDQTNTKVLKANPTLATGDVKVSTDGGAFANITTLPTVTPAAGTSVKVQLSSSEMNGDNVVVAFIDGDSEWCDLFVNIQTTAGQIDEIVLVDTVTTLTNNTPTSGTITTVTNLTNAPTAGDLTSTMKTSVTTAASAATPVATVSGDFSATMKTSLNAATPASVTGNVGGVTGVTFPATVASPTNITAGTITTATNLTNAPTAGDLTATMKTSVGTAVNTQLTTAVADSVPADGSIPSIAQAVYMITQFLSERAISGTTMTVNKPDGTTALMTFTLNSATAPTSLTRAS